MLRVGAAGAGRGHGAAVSGRLTMRSGLLAPLLALLAVTSRQAAGSQQGREAASSGRLTDQARIGPACHVTSPIHT